MQIGVAIEVISSEIDRRGPNMQTSKIEPAEPDVCQDLPVWVDHGVRGARMAKCDPEHLRAAEEAFQHRRWPLTLSGDPGIGKSCLAACLYRRQSGPVIWCNWSDAVRCLARSCIRTPPTDCA